MNTEGNSLPAVSGSERAGCLTTAKSADGSCAHSGASLLPLNVPAFPCKAKPPSKVIESRVQLEAIVPSHCHVESKLGKRKFQTSGMPTAYAFKDKKRSISDYSQEGEADEAGLSLLFAASLLQQKGTLSGEDTLDTVVFESATGAMQEGATNPKTLLKAHRRTTAAGILSSATAVTTSVGYIEPTDNDGRLALGSCTCLLKVGAGTLLVAHTRNFIAPVNLVVRQSCAEGVVALTNTLGTLYIDESWSTTKRCTSRFRNGIVCWFLEALYRPS